MSKRHRCRDYVPMCSVCRRDYLEKPKRINWRRIWKEYKSDDTSMPLTAWDEELIRKLVEKDLRNGKQ